jgi:hypothetical protein
MRARHGGEEEDQSSQSGLLGKQRSEGMSGPSYGSTPGGEREWEAGTGVGVNATPKKTTVPCCAMCCTVFSAFGLLFLLVVGAVLNDEYRYIEVGIEKKEAAKDVLGAAGIYAAFMVLSAIWWFAAAMGWTAACIGHVPCGLCGAFVAGPTRKVHGSAFFSADASSYTAPTPAVGAQPRGSSRSNMIELH